MSNSSWMFRTFRKKSALLLVNAVLELSVVVSFVDPVSEGMHKRQINCTHWTSWLELGGQFAGGPALVKNSRGQIELYVRGIDKRMCVPLHHVASPHFLTHMPVPKSGTEECITRRARAARAGLIRGRVNGRVQSGSSPRSDPSRTSRRRIRSFLRVRRTRGSSASTCR